MSLSVGLPSAGNARLFRYALYLYYITISGPAPAERGFFALQADGGAPHLALSRIIQSKVSFAMTIKPAIQHARTAT